MVPRPPPKNIGDLQKVKLINLINLVNGSWAKRTDAFRPGELAVFAVAVVHELLSVSLTLL